VRKFANKIKEKSIKRGERRWPHRQRWPGGAVMVTAKTEAATHNFFFLIGRRLQIRLAKELAKLSKVCL